MNDWLPVALRAPWWLLLLPLPWLLSHFRGSRIGRPEPYGKFADAHLLKWLVIRPAGTPATLPRRIAWLLIVVAASGPYLPRASDAVTRFGLDIAVVIDISPSMAADDIEPTRLKRAALELRDLAGRLGDDRAALVAFSGYAYRLLPLTHDLELLNYYAGALDPGLTRRHGSNLAQALEFAGQALGDDRGRGRAVVVLSDGETDDRAGALAATDRLQKRGIPVFALGIGTAAGAPVPGATGFLRAAEDIVISRLDRALLARIAQRSGGDYADARPDDRDWDRLIKGLEPLRRSVVVPPQARAGYPLHPWLLAAAFTLLVWGGVRRTPAAVPFCLLLGAVAATPQDAHAAPWQEQAAYDALVEGDQAAAAARYQALDSYSGWLGRGAAHYRLQQWEPALAAFTQAAGRAGDDDERATALYNQGTTLARLGRYAEAERAFERSLQLRPNHARAQLNLNLVRRAGAPPPGSDAGTPRPRDAAPRMRSAPGAAQRDAAAGGEATASAGGLPAAAGADPSEQPPAHSLGSLAALRDHPEEILRHRFMVQDNGRPLTAEGQSW